MNCFSVVLLLAGALAPSPAAVRAAASVPGNSAPATEESAAPTAAARQQAMIDRASGRATGTVIYENLVLVSAGQATPRPAMAIVVDGERIAAVVRVAELTPGQLADATIVDAHGQYAIPGLIDTHVHYATLPDRPWAEADLRRALYSGVTGVRDMAGDVRALADLSRSAWINQVQSPDIFYSALMAGPGFFADKRTSMSSLGRTPGQVPWMQAITDSTDLPLAVAEARGTSATGIKVYADLDGALVRAIIAESRRQHFPVWTHLAIYPATPYDALGANSVSHVGMLARYVLEPQKSSYGHENEPDYSRLDPDGPEIVRYGRALRESGTLLDATLSVYPVATAATVTAGQNPRCSRELAGAIVATLVRQGVQVSAGTDSSGVAEDPFPALYGELESLVRYAGFTPFDAIVAATLNGAKATGIDKDFGSIEAGKYANFLLVAENPLEDIGRLRSITLTVKRGRAFPRTEYHHVPISESEQ